MIKTNQQIKQLLIEKLISDGDLKKSELISIEKHQHGTCCYCRDCNYLHDDCICEHNRLLKIINDVFDNEEKND